MKIDRRAAHRAGFTLLELVVVLAILVILAGLVVGKLDVFQLRANKGVAASNIAGVSRFVQQYFVANNNYPNRWDSLIDPSTNDLWTAPTTTTPGLIPSLVGGPLPGAPKKLAVTTIADNNELYSLTRVGITTVYDLGGGGALPGNRFTALRPLAVGQTVATINSLVPAGQSILRVFYPTNPDGTPNTTGAIPNNKRIIVLGLGPLNELVGATGLLTDAPFYSNTPDRLLNYDRYLGIFEYDAGGGRARFVGALAADADTLTAEIDDFYKIQ